MSIFMNKQIVRHSKLGITLAIPDSNEWKLEQNKSADKG